MPHYHFHCADGGREPDVDGVDLANDAAARQMAMTYAGEVLKNDPQMIWDKGTWRVEVTDQDNILLFTVVTLTIEAPTPWRI